jgi:hypothetical protein
MENRKIAKQVLNYNKIAFDSTFHSISVMQEQTEKLVNSFLQQSSWLSSETKETIKNWVNVYKKGREEFKKTTDQNYEKVDKYFSKDEVVSKKNTKKENNRSNKNISKEIKKQVKNSEEK